MRIPGASIFHDAGEDVLLGQGSFVLLESLGVCFCPARLGNLGLGEDGVQGSCQKHVRIHVKDAVVLGEIEEAEFCELVDPACVAGICGPVCGVEQGDFNYGCSFIGEDSALVFGDVGWDDDEEGEAELGAG